MRPISVPLDDRHMSALETLANEQDLTPAQLLTQALRIYQIVHEHLKAGHELAFTHAGIVIPAHGPCLLRPDVSI